MDFRPPLELDGRAEEAEVGVVIGAVVVAILVCTGGRARGLSVVDVDVTNVGGNVVGGGALMDDVW